MFNEYTNCSFVIGVRFSIVVFEDICLVLHTVRCNNVNNLPNCLLCMTSFLLLLHWNRSKC